MATKMNPRTLKCLVAYDAMPSVLKSVARKARKLALVEARGVLLLRYDLGVQLRAVCEQEGRYTAKGIELLAGYLGVQAQAFYDLITVVRAFTRDQVKDLAGRLMSNGGRITSDHIVAIARARRADRADLISCVFEESLTPRQLRQQIREQETKRRAALEAKRVSGVL